MVSLTAQNGAVIVLDGGFRGEQGPAGVDGAVMSVAGREGHITLTKSDVSLSNVDNTSDTNKPVSTAQQAAIDAAAADALALAVAL